jgi:hypothetical protein
MNHPAAWTSGDVLRPPSMSWHLALVALAMHVLALRAFRCPGCARSLVCPSWQSGRQGTLRVVVEGLRDYAAVLRAPHFSHQVVQRPDLLVIEGIGHPSLMGALRHRGDVNVVRGEEVLRLRAQLGLHVVKSQSNRILRISAILAQSSWLLTRRFSRFASGPGSGPPASVRPTTSSPWSEIRESR